MRCAVVLLSTIFAGIWNPEVRADTDSLTTVGRMTEPSIKFTQNFFNEVWSNVQHFFDNPEEVWVHKNGIYTPNSLHDLRGLAFCEGTFSNEILKKYNSANTSITHKTNFITVASMCLAANEGAEALVNNEMLKFNRKDIPSAGGKFLYGTFQLEALSDGGVKNGCVPSWQKRHNKVDTAGWNRDGTEKVESAMKLMGDPNNQSFNLYCGVHEFFRASATSGKCLNPFKNVNGNNRYGPLREKLNSYKNCVEHWGPFAFDTKDAESLKNAISNKFHSNNGANNVEQSLQPKSSPSPQREMGFPIGGPDTRGFENRH